MTKRKDKTEKIRISYSKVIIYFSGWLPTIRKENVETKNLISNLNKNLFILNLQYFMSNPHRIYNFLILNICFSQICQPDREKFIN